MGSSGLYDGSKTDPRPGVQKRKNRRKTDAPEVIKEQLQYLEDEVSESGKSTDVESKSKADPKKRKSRKSRRTVSKVNYKEVDDAAASDSDPAKKPQGESGQGSSSHIDSNSSSDEEKDWLELRSRKVLQSELDDAQTSNKTASSSKAKRKREQVEISSEEEVPPEDFEETLEKEDWLILRNRKVLQESDEPEVVEVRKSTSKKKSKVKRRGKISFVGSNGSSASDDAATEDWLELRSRK